MEKTDLKELKTRLETLTVFRGLLQDPVLRLLCRCLGEATPESYAGFVCELYEANGGNLGEYIKDICESCENVYVREIGRGVTPPEYIASCVKEELKTLQLASELTPERLCGMTDYQGFLPSFVSGGVNLAESCARRFENIGKYGYGIYAKNRMFYIDGGGSIAPVRYPDSTSLESLVDYEAQRKIIIDNTVALLNGRPAANILLTGDAGTGKSSAVKAVANSLYSEGLRIIQVRKDQLRVIPSVLEALAVNPLKFILFIDDLSFLKDDDNFNALKAVLEGSVCAKSKNVVIYATSNRRHIIKETFSDRDGDDVHRNDTMQELVSLSERFGIHITFGKPGKTTYLNIVKHLARAEGLNIEQEELELSAERFALERGGRSARVARQFVDGLLSAAE